MNAQHKESSVCNNFEKKDPQCWKSPTTDVKYFTKKSTEMEGYEVTLEVPFEGHVVSEMGILYRDPSAIADFCSSIDCAIFLLQTKEEVSNEYINNNALKLHYALHIFETFLTIAQTNLQQNSILNSANQELLYKHQRRIRLFSDVIAIIVHMIDTKASLGIRAAINTSIYTRQI